MHETVKIWFKTLYTEAIADARETIRNEHLWELGYSGDEPNPHTENIALLDNYISELKKKLVELE